MRAAPERAAATLTGTRRTDLPAADLVAAVRAELAAVEPTRACCRAAERAGLGIAALGRARSPAVARLAVRLPVDTARSLFDWSSAPEHCRMAYVRGRFLAMGSLSLAAGRAHLEFVIPQDEASVLVQQLADLGLPAKWRQRRGRGVVTWKSTETVLAFLRLAGAGKAALELEGRLVTRSLRGHLNRVLNAEGANLARTVRNSTRQLEEIEELERSGRLGDLPPAVRELAHARREMPEATYTELAERLGTSRAKVQRDFVRLAAAALPTSS